LRYLLGVSAALLASTTLVQFAAAQEGPADLVKAAVRAEGGADALKAPRSSQRPRPLTSGRTMSTLPSKIVTLDGPS
jgi:hypothetical protein